MNYMIISQLLVNGILMGGIYALIATGLTFIFGILKIVNFAHGSFIMMGMYFSFYFFQMFTIDPYISIFVILPFGVIIGYCIYNFLIKKVYYSPQYIQILLTFAIMIIIDNLALMLFTADPLYIQLSYSDRSLSLGNILISIPRIMTFVFALILLGLLQLGLKKTDTGRAIVASSQSVIGAQLLGMNVQKLYSFAFSLGTVYAVIGGALLMPFFYVSPSVGITFCLKAFIIIVLGGVGSFIGALMGGFMIGIIEAFCGFYFTGTKQDIVVFVIFILIILAKPTGILGNSKQ